MLKKALITCLALGTLFSAHAQQWETQNTHIKNTNTGSVVIGGRDLGDYPLIDFEQAPFGQSVSSTKLVQPIPYVEEAIDKIKFHVPYFSAGTATTVTVTIRTVNTCNLVGFEGKASAEDPSASVTVNGSGWYSVSFPGGALLKSATTHYVEIEATNTLAWSLSDNTQYRATNCTKGTTLSTAINLVALDSEEASEALEVRGRIRAEGMVFPDGSTLEGSRWSGNTSIIHTTASRVGIGVENPLTQLHLGGDIRGGGTEGSLRINGTQGYVEIGPRNANFLHFITDRPWFYFNNGIQVKNGYIRAYNTSNMYLQTGGNTRMTLLNSNGNVGIGTTNPQHTLDVNGTLNAQQLMINGQAVSGWNPTGNNTSTGQLSIGDADLGLAKWQLQVNVPASVTSTDYRGIKIDNYSTTGIGQGLNIGFESSTPFQTGIQSRGRMAGVVALSADVNSFGTTEGTGLYAKGTYRSIVAVGDADIDGDLNVTGSVDVTSIATENLTLDRLGLGTSSPQEVVELQHQPGAEAKIRFSHPETSNYFTAGLNSTGEKWQIKRMGAPVFTVEEVIDNGNPNATHSMVVIGSGFQAGDGVELRGNILIHAQKWEIRKPDYVFKDDYDLMSLDELRTFIDLNGHLPGVTSAAQEEADGGYELTTSLYQQLEKIEELTLYVLDLQEQLKAQQAEIEALKKEAGNE